MPEPATSASLTALAVSTPSVAPMISGNDTSTNNLVTPASIPICDEKPSSSNMYSTASIIDDTITSKINLNMEACGIAVPVTSTFPLHTVVTIPSYTANSYKPSKPPTFIQPYATYLTTKTSRSSTKETSRIKERLDAVLQTNGQYLAEDIPYVVAQPTNHVSHFDIETSSDRELLVQIFHNSQENRKQIQELQKKMNKIHDAIFQMKLKSPRMKQSKTSVSFSQKRKDALKLTVNETPKSESVVPYEKNENVKISPEDTPVFNMSLPALTIEIPPPSDASFNTSSIVKTEPSSPKHSIKSRKRSKNDCTYYIRKMLSQEFTRDELNCGGYTSGVKKYKNNQIVSVALSPNRLQKIIDSSRRKFPGEFEKLSFSKIVNEKCRKTRLYKEKCRRESDR